MVEPVDIANAVLYLGSDDGRYVTGNTPVMDAGGQRRPTGLSKAGPARSWIRSLPTPG
jgi:hypothetical protein